MENKRRVCVINLIVVCGCNHSGTSAVAKLLLNHGSITGPLNAEKSVAVPYEKYEDNFFRSWCRDLLRIEIHDRKQSLSEYLDGFIHGANIVLKYPKSALLLPLIKEVISSTHTMKVVFVMRNFVDNMNAEFKRTGCNPLKWSQYYSDTYKTVSYFEGPVFPFMFEKLRFNDVDHISRLLEFCGLGKHRKINMKGINGN